MNFIGEEEAKETKKMPLKLVRLEMAAREVDSLITTTLILTLHVMGLGLVKIFLHSNIF